MSCRWIAAVVSLLWATSVLAQGSPPPAYTVERSSARALPAGQSIARDETIKLAADEEIILIDRTGQQVLQRVCQGPFSGPIDKCAKPCGTVPTLLGRCSSAGGSSKGLVPGGSRDTD